MRSERAIIGRQSGGHKGEILSCAIRRNHNLHIPEGISHTLPSDGEIFHTVSGAAYQKDFNTREKNDILPEHNPDMYLVPQILANDAKVLDTVEKLKMYGYDEVNLNLGCPSKTVVSKGRGSGFLIHTEKLERFLDEIYAKADVKISIKTRIGKYDADEWGQLLDIYNKYPVEELIVHPRVQQQFYKGHPDLDAFADAVKECRHPFCYNGDIFTVEDMERLKNGFRRYPVLCWGVES